MQSGIKIKIQMVVPGLYESSGVRLTDGVASCTLFPSLFFFFSSITHMPLDHAPPPNPPPPHPPARAHPPAHPPPSGSDNHAGPCWVRNAEQDPFPIQNTTGITWVPDSAPFPPAAQAIIAAAGPRYGIIRRSI